jgi:hypothetical protein
MFREKLHRKVVILLKSRQTETFGSTHPYSQDKLSEVFWCHIKSFTLRNFANHTLQVLHFATSPFHMTHKLEISQVNKRIVGIREISNYFVSFECSYDSEILNRLQTMDRNQASFSSICSCNGRISEEISQENSAIIY